MVRKENDRDGGQVRKKKRMRMGAKQPVTELRRLTKMGAAK